MKGYLAVDIAKNKLDSRISKGLQDPGSDLSEQPNNFKGFKRLLRECTKAGITELHVCIEATGAYWIHFANFFFQAGAKVYVVNPARIKAQRKTELRRSKTDKVDAGVILRFLKAQITELHPWCPPSPAVRALQSLVRFRESLVSERSGKKNYLKSLAATPTAARMAKEQVSALDKDIAQVENEIQQVISSDPHLNALYGSATSIPNVAFVTAAVLLAELRGFAEIRDPRQATAFAGLDVVQEESGTIKKPPRISKTGNKLLRSAFYRIAPGVVRRPGQFRDLFHRLRARGLRKKQAYAAVARKLLEIAVAICVSGGTFDHGRYQPS